MIIVLAFIIGILFIESVYCFAMKKRQHHKTDAMTRNADTGDEKNTVEKSNSYSVAVNKIIFIMNDIVFLTAKLVGYIPLHCIRKLLYKYVFWMSIGKRVVIYYGLETRSPWNISIGNGSVIGDHAILDARFGIKVGENVNLSTGVWMWTLQHDVNSASFSVEGQGKSIHVGDRVWISSRVSVLPGAVLEDGCVIAANAVALGTKYDACSIYGGVPAKKISSRNDKINYVFDGRHRLFL